MSIHLFPGSFHCNWDPIFQEFDSYEEQARLQPKVEIPVYSLNAYNYETYTADGGDRVFYRDINENWHTMGGPYMARKFPFLGEMQDALNAQGIRATIMLSKLKGNGGWHSDLERDICTLNIFAHDADAVTYLKEDDGTIVSYPTKAGQMRLINGTKPHCVKNTGVRRWLQTRIYGDYHLVKEFLTKNHFFETDIRY